MACLQDQRYSPGKYKEKKIRWYKVHKVKNVFKSWLHKEQDQFIKLKVHYELMSILVF